MNILFICKHNIFRSKIAEAYFKKINKNPAIKARSGGLIVAIGLSRLQKQGIKSQRKVARSFGIKIKGKPKSLNVRFLKKQDLIIIVANDIPPVIFNNKEYVKKLETWKIPDEQYNNEKNIKRTIRLIMKKTKELAKKIENAK